MPRITHQSIWSAAKSREPSAQTRQPAHSGKPRPHSIGRHLRQPQRPHCRQHRRRIPWLKLAAKLSIHITAIHAAPLIQPPAIHLPGHHRHCHHQRRSGSRRGILEHPQHIALGLAHHHRHPGLDYPSLLHRYLPKRITQKSRMILRYISDHTQLRHDYVCAVKPAAKPHLHHSYIHLPQGKPLERHGHRQLKKRRMPVLHIRHRQITLHKIHHGIP